MPVVKHGKKRLRFPDDMTEQEMEAAIQTIPEEEPESPTLDRLKARKIMEGKPPLISDEVRREALERRYGYIAEDPFSVRTMIGNIPQNIEEIVASIGSFIAGSAVFMGKFGKNFYKDVNEFAANPDYSDTFPWQSPLGATLPKVEEQFKPATDLGKAIYYDWKALLAGRVPEEIGKLPAGQIADAIFEKVDRQGIGTTLKHFIQDHPVDAMLLGTVSYRLLAAGSRLTVEGVSRVIPDSYQISTTMEEILSTQRTPIVYNVGKTLKGKPQVVAFERAYSKDPLTKYMFQKSFDAVLDKYPKMRDGLAEHKAKKLINNLRNSYEDATFEERSIMHREIFEKLDTLTKGEQAIVVPYLEGRAALIREPSDQFRAFEGWYRGLVDDIQRNLIERGKLVPKVITARMYQPLASATGQSIEQVVSELGEFRPVYVHHTFPKIFEDKTGIHFAETTGQRYRPSFLKRSKGKEGYSENMAEILPKWTSEYIKYKNTEAFLNEFTTKFGIKTNIKDIKPVEGGLAVTTGKTLKGDDKSVFVRLQEEGIPDASKPQGLYLAPKHREDLIGDMSGVRYEYEVRPKNPLTVEKDVWIKHARGKGLDIPASSGIKALKKLTSENEFDRLIEMNKKDLIAELSSKYPDVDWSRYYDTYEMLEGYAGKLARSKGYDAIMGDLDEIVVLNSNLLKTPKPLKEPIVYSGKTISKKTVTEDESVPRLIAVSTRGSQLYLEFDNRLGPVPDVSAIKKYARDSGFSVGVVKFKGGLKDELTIGGARDTTRYRLDVFDKEDRLSSKAAAALSEKFGGDFRQHAAKLLGTRPKGYRPGVSPKPLAIEGKVAGELSEEPIVYSGYKIVAPDGYLQFYRGKIDFYKEVSKRMEHSTFDEAIGGALEGMVKEYTGVGKNQIVYLVPKELIRELETFATPVFGSQKAQDVIRLAVDKPTQIWKDLVLASSPRWIKNNVMGDIIFNSMERVGPLSYSRAFTSIYRDTIPDELLKASFANIMKYNPKLGKTAETTLGQLVAKLEETKVVKGIARVKDTGYAINTMFEQPFVRALYVDIARKKAVSMLKAEKLPRTEVNILNKMRVIKENPELSGPLIGKVKETLPVFNLVGSWERKYLRRAAPFVNWYKFMVQYAAKLPAKHPFLTVGGRGLGALSEHQREEVFKEYFPFMAREIEENGIPLRLANLWPVGEIGKDTVTFFNTRGLNPFATIDSITSLELLPLMSPVITVPFEQITGRAVFGDREFRSGKEGIAVTSEGKIEFRDFTAVRPPLWDHILRQLPQYSLAKQVLVPAKQFDTGTILNPDPILDPVTGEYKYPIQSIEKVLNFMGIDRKTLDVWEVWNTYLRRKRTAFGRAVSKEVSKDNMSFEDIRQVFKDVLGDKELVKKIKGEMELEQEKKMKHTRELLEKTKEEKFKEEES